MNKPLVAEAQLQAWVDGQLPATAQGDVEAWLRDHPQDAVRLAHYRQQNAALRGIYDAVLDEAVPERLNSPARRASRVGVLAGWPYAAMLACFLVGSVAGAGVGWWWFAPKGDSARGAAASPAFVRQAAMAHVVYSPEVRHPVEVGADQEAHLTAWLSKRLGTQLRVPHLGDQGFSLVGGRLLPGQPDDRSPVAHFMYQDGKGQRLTLYVRVNAEPTRESAFRFAQEKNVGVFYWLDQKLGYALSGEIDKADLLRVATAVYKQLNP